MKGLILAAGRGTRLAPYTNDKPKCMVKYNDKAIIDYILDTMERCGVEDRVVINGYKKEVLEKHLSDREVRFCNNENYASTNMVSTLFCAKKEMSDDVIISYSDIIYNDDILSKLIDCEADIACVVDGKWRELWVQRMEDPLTDAESMKIDKDGNIIELGKKPRSYEDIEGQYIGLIKISKNVVAKVKEYYESLDKNAKYDGNDYYNMYMTSLLQMIIENLMPIRAVVIEGGWVEIDKKSDLFTKMVF